jgi:hypothetical protein
MSVLVITMVDGVFPAMMTKMTQIDISRPILLQPLANFE